MKKDAKRTENKFYQNWRDEFYVYLESTVRL